jgi:hypothetical protein
MRKLLALPLAGWLAACQSMATAGEQPAVLSDNDPETRAALQDALTAATGAPSVRLADDAFVNSSVLVLEFGPKDSIGAPPAQGRMLDRPLRFRLVKDGEACFIVDERDGRRTLVDGVSCRPESG